MKKFLIILGLLLAAILQVSVISFFSIRGVAPNLVLVLILFLVIIKKFEKTWILLILISLFLDLFSGYVFGLVSLSLIITAYLIDLLNRKIFSIIKFWIIALFIIIGTIIYNILLIILARLFDTNLILNFNYLLMQIIYNLILSALLFYGFKKIFRQT